MKSPMSTGVALFLLLLLQAAPESLTQEDETFPPDMSMADLADYWNFDMETHTVTTDDGYILELHRLPHSGVESSGQVPPAEDKPVVFIQHGLTGASSRYLMGPTENSICYILADRGYDVWMGNTRGNTYSRAHVSLDPDEDKEEFWSFDWEVAARGDFPAVFDYILANTGKTQLHYVGTSMGSTEFLVAMTEEPQLQEMVEAAFLMCPVAYMDGVTGFLDVIANFVDPLEDLFETLGVWEVTKDKPITSVIGHDYCDEDDFPDNEEFCLNLADSQFGLSEGQLNVTMLPWMFDYKSEGSSTKMVVHYGQIVGTDSPGRFQKYDLGAEANLSQYGSEVPPEYDLASIDVPVYVFYGDSDTLAVQSDVERLIQELPNVKLDYLVPLEGWTHNDFSLAIDAGDLVYRVIADEMDALRQQE